MKRFLPFAFLGLAPAAAFSQHSEFNIGLPAITLYPACGNPAMSASGIQFKAALEYLFFFNDFLGAGAVAGASLFSPQEVYPSADGFVIAFHACAAADALRGEVLDFLVLARAGVMLSFSDIHTSTGDLAGVYFQGDVSAGIRFNHFPIRILIGVETIDFRNLGIRFETALTFRLGSRPSWFYSRP